MTRLLPSVFVLVAASAFAAPPPPVSALAYQPNGTLLAAGTHGSVAIIDAKGDIVATLPGQSGRVTALAFARDGQWLAVASGEPAKSGMVNIYTVAGTKFELQGTLAGLKDVQYALDFHPNGKLLAVAGYDRVVRIFDRATRTVNQEFKDHSDAIYGVAYSPDGKLFASASADRTVKLWDPASGKRLYTIGEPTDWVYALAWHPEGKRLAAAGVDKSLRIWEVTAESSKLVQSAFAHTEPVTKIAYAHDGQFIYSIGEGKNIKKWDSSKLVERLVFPPQSDTMLALAVRPDGKQIAIGRFDGVLQLFDTGTGKVAGEPLPAKPKPPTVGKLTPNFGPRGTTVKVSVAGQHLDGDWQVTAAHPGVAVKVNAERQLELVLGKDVPPGPIALTLKTAAGAAAPINFIVDRYPVVTDAVAIDSARQGREVRLPATLVGTLDRAGQADYFRFQAKAGQEIGAQILTAAVGSKLDAVLEIAAADGRVLVESTNGLIAYTCPTDGTYAIGVHDREYRGGGDMSYRLHVGDVPIVTAVQPMGVQRGGEATVQLLGVNLPVRSTTVRVPPDAVVGSRLPVPLTGEKPLGDASIIVGEFAETVVGAGGAVIATPGTANGVIAAPGAQQSVRFAAKKGQRLLIEVNARRAGSPLDSTIELLDGQGKPVGRSTLRCTARTVVVFRDHDSAAPGIRIESWNDLAMDDYVYLGNELLRIVQLPLNPDADCSFYSLAGQRLGYLDTTPGHHPAGTPVYKVEMHPPGSTFPPNGLPVFHVNYRNDDGGPGFGKDSRLTFDPPADGEYTARIGDARNEGGPNFGYRLTVRPPRPDFTVSFSPTAPSVWKGGAVPINVSINRIDGFDGPVQVRFESVPTGFEAPATSVEAGQQSTTFAMFATPAAKSPPVGTPPLKLMATATIAGKEIVREALGGAPKVVEPGDLVTATVVGEVAIRPGSEARLLVKIERRNGFKGRVPLDVKGLPHGVRVLDIGLNGILITERDTQREVALYAEPWVKPMERPLVVLSRREGKNTEHAAKSVLLRVQK